MRKGLNNSATKICTFLTGGAYAPYAPCLSTPLCGNAGLDDREVAGSNLARGCCVFQRQLSVPSRR